MGVKRSIFLFSLFSSLQALACFSANNSFSSSISSPKKNEGISHHLHTPTCCELERVENISSGQVCQSTTGKKLMVAFLRNLIATSYSDNAGKMVFAKISHLAVRAYLFHIYPSHTFW